LTHGGGSIPELSEQLRPTIETAAETPHHRGLGTTFALRIAKTQGPLNKLLIS